MILTSEIPDGQLPPFLVTFRKLGLPKHCVEFALTPEEALEQSKQKNPEGEGFKVKSEITDPRRLKVCLHLANLG